MKPVLLATAALALAALTAAALPAQAQQGAPSAAASQIAPQSDAQALATVVENYLRGITSLKARFIQTSGNGKQAAGDFMLKRPGKMRFDYDAPITDFIVADGRFIYYYDGALKEQSNTLISQSLADFFLRDNLTLSGDLKVADIKRAAGMVQLTLVQAKDQLAGSLTLGFTETPPGSAKPLQLKKWRVVDAQGQVTEVELFDVQEGIKLKDDLFHYYDPERAKPNFN